MKYIQRLCVNRPIATIMFYLIIIIMGFISLTKLEINLLPKLEFPRITIITVYPNSSPEEVENLITKPVSESVGTVSGIKKISSESLEGLSFVTIQFAWGTNIDIASMEIRERLDLIRSILPEDSGRSVVTKFDPSQNSIFDTVVFSNNMHDPKQLRYFLTTEVKNYLDRIDGVAYVQFAGGHQKEIHIEVDHEKMYSYGISLNQIEDAISQTNVNFPVGRIKSGNSDIIIRTIGEYSSVADIGETIVGVSKNGIAIKLNSLATITDTYKDQTGFAKFNEKKCVLISFYKEAGKNTISVADEIKSTLNDINSKFSSKINFQVVFDQSMFVKNSIDNIVQSLLLGAILSIVILVLFLLNFNSPFVLICSVFVSVLATFLLMFMNGISLNMMSLGGLSVGIGMLYDSGNVVLSAVTRNIEKGITPKEAAFQGVTEVTESITSAIITTTIVFLPLIFLKSIVGVVFSDMAITICFSLGVNWVISLTLIPMLSAHTSSQNKTISIKSSLYKASKSFFKRLELLYEKLLIHFIERKKTVFLFIGLFFSIAVMYLYVIDKEFIPKVDTGEFEIEVNMPKGTTLTRTDEIISIIEKRLLQYPHVQYVISNIGFDEDQLLTRKGKSVGTHHAVMKIILNKKYEIETEDFIKHFRDSLTFREDIKINYIVKGDILSSILSSNTSDLVLELSGEDLSVLSYLGNTLRDNLHDIEGITDITTSMEDKDREFHVSFIPDKLASYGLTHDKVSQYLKAAIKGNIPTKLRVADKEIDVRVSYSKNSNQNLENIESYQILRSNDNFIYLSDIIQIEEKKGLTSIIREGQNRINKITANIDKTLRRNIYNKIDSMINELKLPLGYSLQYGGEKENIKESFLELFFAMILAIILIYMVLAGILESFVYPFVIMGAIPLILIGVVPALFITGKTINIISITGLILLMGMVVDSGVLFFEYYRLIRKEGEHITNAIMHSGKLIMRVILMNSATTIFALIPIGLELGEGTEFQSPLAITVIGGMMASIFLALFMTPLLIYLLEMHKEKKNAD